MHKPFVGAVVAASLTLAASPLAARSQVAPAPSRQVPVVSGAAAETGEAVTVSGARAAQVGMRVASTGTGVKRLRVVYPRRAVAQSRMTITGTAPAGRRGRAVALFVKADSAWKRAAGVKADARGRFRLAAKVPSGAGRTTWKVTARRFGAKREQSVTFTVRVTARRVGTPDPTTAPPTSAPLGSPTAWTYITAGTSMRWDPCDDITWHYSPDQQAYPGAERDIARAIAMIGTQTGFTFTRTDQKNKALLTLGWATPAQEPMLRGSTLGVGGPSYQMIDSRRNPGTDAVIVSGEVTFDATETGRAGFLDASGWSWGQVFLHEVMHTMGLGHAREQVQVMYSMASTKNQRFGAGDLTGLTTVGAEKGCIDWAMDVNPRSRLRTALVAE